MTNLFFLFYSLLSLILYSIAAPFLLLFSLKRKYRQSIPARFFLWKNMPLKRDGVWFHSCSFGEAKSIKPLVDALPQECLRMSTTTQTGFSALLTYTEESRYLPFEPLLFLWQRPQKVLVVMEAEFWYLLFVLAKKRGAKTLLVNARLSDRSFPKYIKMRWFYRQIFNAIDEVYAQTEEDKIRLEQLGAQNVIVTGNIKLSVLPKPNRKLHKPKGMLVCAASTHEGEEAMILEAYAALKSKQRGAKLLLVPRHPERFGTVTEMVEKFVQKHRLSMQCYAKKSEIDADITIVDVLGELVNLYAISDLVILGGAFEPIGGHNAAEAAQFGCKIISGKHYFNQKDIFSAIEGMAIVEISDLTKSLLQHTLLPRTKIVVHTKISPIVKSIRNAL